ncbi:hypothetical protein R9C00_29320 [Flammeovirgaceae bacterium SG7u.111]|nr:hypothetical protein [Flammeovirgaceae bacterium SG7u.132]WPO35801.1 hypothetical protein R9C00_29320 [Flammeovirgaceae bacterium SG7u.111]
MMTHFEKLPLTLRRNGYDYTLLERTEYKAIYLQELDGKEVAYEILRIQKNKSTLPRVGDESVFYKEIFPKNEDFGLNAWTVKGKEKAFKLYHSIMSASNGQLEIKF